MFARTCLTPDFTEVFIRRKKNEDNSFVYQQTKQVVPDSVPSLSKIPYIQSYLRNHTAIDVSVIYKDSEYMAEIQPSKKRRRLIGESDEDYERLGLLANGSLLTASGASTDSYKTNNGVPPLDQLTPTDILELLFTALSIISNEKQNFEDHQVDMLMRMIMSSVKNLFKESVLEHFDYLKKTFKSIDLQFLHQLLKDLILLARRRGGKTSTLCALLAAVMAVIPSQNILFFSTGERISMMGRDKIIDFLDALKHTEATRKFSNISYKTGKETLRVKNIFGTWSRANFYPAKEDVSNFL